MVLVFRVISQDLLIKLSCDVAGRGPQVKSRTSREMWPLERSSSWKVAILSILLAIVTLVGDIMFLVCKVTSIDHVI